MAIGELNQTDLHEQLKQHYCDASGALEVEVDGYVVDVLNPTEIVEIQTRHLGKLRKKLTVLCANHAVRLVHPVPALTHLVKTDRDGNLLSSRRSPRRGTLHHAFREISSIADMVPGGNLTLEIALVEITEFRRDDGEGSWRRHGVSIVGRKLDRVVERHTFKSIRDFAVLLPDELPEPFTNKDYAQTAGLRYALVQPVTSSLRKMGLIEISGKQGNTLVYRRA